VAADDGRGRNLVVIEIDNRGRLAQEVFLELPVRSAEEGVGNQVAMLVVGTEPLGAAQEQILRDEGALDRPAVGVGVVGAGAAGSQVRAKRAFDAPVLGEPI